METPIARQAKQHMMDEKIKIASSPYFLNNYIEIMSSILGKIVKVLFRLTFLVFFPPLKSLFCSLQCNDASPGCDKVVTQFHSETAPR
jgi:hypothetical protein